MKHILAVDDNPANLTLVRETLKEKYKVSVVTSGDQALRFLELKTPDLILLDVCMPEMGGMETLKRINESFGTKFRVVLMTALADDDLSMEGERNGAAACIAKPFVPEEMISTVMKVIGE